MSRANKVDGFALSMIFLIVGIIILYGFVVVYAPSSDERHHNTMTAEEAAAFRHRVNKFYAYFQDVHVMIFLGFGFLMSFLRRYGYFATGINYMLSALCVVWTIPVLGLAGPIYERIFRDGTDADIVPVRVDLTSLVNADFGAAAVMISFGAVLGKTSPAQLVWMAIIEIIFYSINIQIGDRSLKITDVGGTIYIHCFGAYFGLAVASQLSPKDIRSRQLDKDNRSVYHSDLFSMLGTIFLWCFWPSFNAALAQQTPFSQERTVINTLLSLCSSCMSAFFFSKLVRGGKFDMVDIQNATLAGGVAMGAASNLMIQPFGAMIVGTAAGIISANGFAKVNEYLWLKLGIHDTAGVHNLHGMPAVFGGIISAIVVAANDDKEYSGRLGSFFVARHPNGRSQGQQAAYQLAELGVTLLIAIVSGVATGFLLKQPMFEKPSHLFSDEDSFNVPSEETPLYFGKNAADFELRSRVPESRTVVEH